MRPSVNGCRDTDGFGLVVTSLYKTWESKRQTRSSSLLCSGGKKFISVSYSLSCLLKQHASTVCGNISESDRLRNLGYRVSPSLPCIPEVYYKSSLYHPEISCHNIWTAASDSCLFAPFRRHGGQRSALIRWSVRIWEATLWGTESQSQCSGVWVSDGAPLFILYLSAFNKHMLKQFQVLRGHVQWIFSKRG